MCHVAIASRCAGKLVFFPLVFLLQVSFFTFTYPFFSYCCEVDPLINVVTCALTHLICFLLPSDKLMFLHYRLGKKVMSCQFFVTPHYDFFIYILLIKWILTGVTNILPQLITILFNPVFVDFISCLKQIDYVCLTWWFKQTRYQ